MIVTRHGVPAFILGLLMLAARPASATDEVKIEGYLEFRKEATLIVDGQRVRAGSRTRFKGSGKARSVETIPLGYEIEVKGERRKDGSVKASEIEAKPNGKSYFEDDVMSATDEAEKAYVRANKVFSKTADGQEQVVGALITTGPQVERAKRIVERVRPPYVEPSRVRLYVVDNKEWNAMAMANYSIYVYSGLMADMDDDELAIVLGHEIAHATHEHSRRQASRGVLGGIAGAVTALGAGQIKNEVGRTAAGMAGALGVSAFNNSYSRDQEDQADRAGLRYVYESGYDYRKAPGLWRKFAAKYGDGNKIENFFFGDHSLSKQRATDLEREIRNNYRDAAKDPPTRKAG